MALAMQSNDRVGAERRKSCVHDKRQAAEFCALNRCLRSRSCQRSIGLSLRTLHKSHPVLLSRQTITAALRAIPGVDTGLCPRSVYDDLARGIALRRFCSAAVLNTPNLQFDRFDLALTV